MPSQEKPVVAVEKADSHHDGVYESLRLIEDDIAKSLKGKKEVLIKPNFVTTTKPLAASHVDSARAVLEVISRHFEGRYIFGEGPSSKPIEEGIKNYGYESLIREYDMRVVDFNKDQSIEVEGLDSQLKPLKYHVSKTLLQSDYLVSVAKAKTHDTVIVTLSVKNIVVGSLVSTKEKQKIHQGFKAMNINIAKFIRNKMPNLAIVDGFEGMEGDGPEFGTPIQLGVSAASLYPVSLDAVMAKIMGFDPMSIGYLYHLDEWGVGVAKLAGIEVVGRRIDEVARKFKPHTTYKEQLEWK
jgi:uncharacterized protein (DUF362 family)